MSREPSYLPALVLSLIGAILFFTMFLVSNNKYTLCKAELEEHTKHCPVQSQVTLSPKFVTVTYEDNTQRVWTQKRKEVEENDMEWQMLTDIKE